MWSTEKIFERGGSALALEEYLMKYRSVLFMAILVLGSIVTISSAKDLVSGTYRLIEVPDVDWSGGLEVVQVSKDKIKFSLSCSLGPPSYNQASAEGFATHKNNQAFYKDGDCEITFSFKDNTVFVEEKNTWACMFYGNAVSCGGLYKLKSREIPNLDNIK